MISKGFLAMTEREMIRLLSLYKQTLFPSLISAGLYIIIFGQSLGSKIGEIKGIPYILYIIPGLIMMSVINPAYQNSSSSLMQSKFLKFIEDILITPISGFEICLSFIIGATFRGILNGLLVYLLAYILCDFQFENFFLSLTFIFLVSWTFAALGVIVGIFSKTWDSIMVFTNFIFTPLIFLGGVFYSIDMLSPFWKSLTKLNPVYWMINGLRYSSLGIQDTSYMTSLWICILFALIFSLIASWLFTRGYGIKT